MGSTTSWAGIPELQKGIKTKLNIGKQTRFIKTPCIYSSLLLTVNGKGLAEVPARLSHKDGPQLECQAKLSLS